jgi:hypothetical protein
MRTPPPRTSASASPTTSSSSRPRPRWPRPSAICRRPWTTPT